VIKIYKIQIMKFTPGAKNLNSDNNGGIQPVAMSSAQDAKVADHV
jgi:hypothetical protein